PMEISELVIVGKSLAMIVRGDTVIYNANKFNTLMGDNLGELIKQMPGLDYNSGALTYNGEPISRITIGGKRLFGSDVQAALTNMYAEDVEAVEVYKEKSDVAKHFGLENAPMERVMNVKTKREINVVKNADITLAAGQGLPKNKNFDDGVINKENLSTSFFMENLQLQSYLDHAKNLGTGSPNELYNASLSVSISKKLFNLSSKNTFGHNMSQNSITSANDYFPTEMYLSRRHSSITASDNKTTDFSSGNAISLYRGKHYISGNIGFIINKQKSNYHGLMSDITDGALISGTDMKSYDMINSRRINFFLSDTYYFKNKNTFAINVRGAFGNNSGDGWRVDTTATTTFRTCLTNNLNGHDISYGFGLGYNIFISKSITANIYYTYGYSDVRSKRVSYDNLLLETDTLNTYDYTLKSFENSGQLGLTIMNEKLFLTAKATYSNKHKLRDERFPGNYDFPRVFNNLLPSVNFEYSFSSTKNFTFRYRASAHDLSTEELRGVIDNRNPLMLKAGNPQLKQPVNNKLQTALNITSPSIGISYNVSIDAAYLHNYITYKTHYFQADADSYQGFEYSFVKGTTFMIPENTEGRWDLKAVFSFKKRIELLRSTLNAQLNYNYSRTPFILDEVLNMRLVNGGSLSLGFSSGFSKKITINLSSVSGAGTTKSLTKNNGGTYSSTNGAVYNNMNGNTYNLAGSGYNNDSYYYYTQHVNLSIRSVIKKRYTLSTNAKYNYQYYEAMPGFRRDEVIWNAELRRNFGKQNKLEVAAKIFDILNQTNTNRISIVDNYIQTSSSWFLGRFWTIEAKYKF
ncbi:MAG: outer membrane beta-barrel protein, partial [Bacteroidales bacterium]|nr:outer membrane beta-barrel protein [Bacteroidales bacterium]